MQAQVRPIPALLSQYSARVGKFLLVGASGVPVNIGCVALAVALLPGVAPHLRDVLAFAGGIVVSTLTNFLLHHSWTWADRTAQDGPGALLGRLARFGMVSALAASVQWATAIRVAAQLRRHGACNRALLGDFRLYHLLATCAGILLGVGFNFVLNNGWTFRKRAC